MGKYHSYAARLDESFKAARDEYAAAWSKLQDAQRKYDEAQQWHSGESPAERELNTAKAKIALVEAQRVFEKTGPAAWDTFNQTRAELRKSLEAEVKENSVADPSAIDTNALELLKSGIMTPDDYYKMAERFDGNATMTRMISRYAKDAAEDADDHKSRAALHEIAVTCADGLGSVMRAWDGLSQIADYCSGRSSRGRRNAPEQVIAMGKWWEQLSADAVENF